ncbi:MAG: CehA/McbA family metallohydrolase [Aestuariivita sp.]|nr:CehA/McbA family metallohydrolase [Aestuariivita sp.]
MQDPAFTSEGRFWRGNLHTHSTRSDGVVEPEEVCRRYQASDYDFIAITDHFIGTYDYPLVDTTVFRNENFTTLIGAELHSGALENGNLWHILAVGLPQDFVPTNTPEFFPIPGQETGPEVTTRARNAGAFIAIAHPEWSGLTLNDTRSLDAAHAIEVYNHGCQICSDRGHGFWHLDRLLEENRRLTLCATDDAHFNEPDHFGGWTMVKAKENTPEALLDALKAGHMYASTGPEIHQVDWRDDKVKITCSPAAVVTVQGSKCSAETKYGDNLTHITLPLNRFSASPFMRVTVIDQAGRRAWTNPIWKS